MLFAFRGFDSFQTRWSEGKPMGGASPGSRASARLQHPCGCLRDIAPPWRRIGSGCAADPTYGAVENA